MEVQGGVGSGGCTAPLPFKPMEETSLWGQDEFSPNSTSHGAEFQPVQLLCPAQRRGACPRVEEAQEISLELLAGHTLSGDQ